MTQNNLQNNSLIDKGIAIILKYNRISIKQ